MKINSIQKVSRGQVWYISDDNTSIKLNNRNDHVVAKGRPWVVVSCEQNNIFSPIVNCVPVSSGSDDYPMHVIFNGDRGSNRILCEQIRTFNLDDLKEYQFTLTKDIMRKVDEALIGQLELNLSLPSYEMIASMIEKIAEYKAKEMNDKYQNVTDDAILELCSRIESVFAPKPVKSEEIAKLSERLNTPEPSITLKKVTEVKPSVHTDLPVTEPKSEIKGTNVKYTTSEGSVVKSKGKSTKRKWDNETVKNFLNDLKVLSLDDMVIKYELKDKKAVYMYKHYFNNQRSSK